MVDLDHLAVVAGARRRRLASAIIVSATRGDVVAVEGGQHQHPEVAVIGAVGVQQAVAEQRPQVGEAPLAPLEGVEVADQDLMVDLGADRPHDRLVQQAQREHGAEPALVLEQQAQRVGDDPPGVVPARRQASGGQPGPATNPPLPADVIGDAATSPITIGSGRAAATVRVGVNVWVADIAGGAL